MVVLANIEACYSSQVIRWLQAVLEIKSTKKHSKFEYWLAFYQSPCWAVQLVDFKTGLPIAI